MTSWLRTALLSGVLGYRALFAWSTPGLFVASLVLAPVLQLVFFLSLGSSLRYGDPEFFVVGNAIQVSAAAGVSGLVSVIADERRFGTLSVILGSPGSAVAVFVGRLIPGVVLGTSVSVMTGLVGLAFTGSGTTLAGSLFFVLTAVVAASSCSALGLALSALGLVYRDIYQVATAAYLALLVFSGSNVDRADIPPVVRWIGDLLPTTHAIEAARGVLAGGSAGAAAPLLLAELGVGVAWGAAALIGMRILAHRARVLARVELF
ncbi:ABC transporter permease [Leifsonia sp. ZF2019]|uniref:ABC transporter permease n=1 Tax=Leifsonia sp. ZF2019 TaxID=2781978 RepID=UPI001CBE05CB|nr:ABC transporter permease [Leifsonia sp. ZF2019]UAJ79777.1 ABC transporter permease [Leifsonia sp. ZF2019]